MDDLRIWWNVMNYLSIANVVRFLRTSQQNKKIIESYLKQILPPRKPLGSRLKSIYACKYCHKCNVLDVLWKQTGGSDCTYCEHECCRCGREYSGPVDPYRKSNSDSDSDSDSFVDYYSDNSENYDSDDNLIPRSEKYIASLEEKRQRWLTEKKQKKFLKRYKRTRPHSGLCKKCGDYS